jgi:hypothetical protein
MELDLTRRQGEGEGGCGTHEPTCESCGGEFACGATLKGCWCSEVKLSDAALAELRERFKGCLCRECLERFAARERGAVEG